MSTEQAPKTTDYLVRINRSANGRLSDDDYAHLGTWGVAGDDYDVDATAILMVTPGREDEAEAILDADPGVVSWVVPTLYDHATGDEIRAATPTELAASRAAAERDGGAGVIEVEGRRCYVQE